MTTAYYLTIPSLGVSLNLTYLESKISEIPPGSVPYALTILNYVVEMSFLIAIYIIILPAIVTFWKAAILHENLKRITISYFCHIALYLLLRTVIFLYQIRLFDLTGHFLLDFPFVLAHFARVYHVYSIYSVMMAYAVERCAATVMVSDYEVKSRFYISRTLIVYISAAAMIAPTLAVLVASSEGKTGNLIGTFVMVSQLIASTVILTLIWTRNIVLERRLKMRIAHNRLTTEYTIGKKYQVQENLKSFKFIRNMVGSCIPLGAISLAISTYNIGKPQDLQSFLRSYIDLFTTGGLLLSVVVGMLSLPEWRDGMALRARHMFSRRGADPAVKAANLSSPPHTETEIYFKQLRDSWNI